MLGEKIKQARLEKGLSQRQLCGEEITRNMLSQIENGSARPSMATLTYLAKQLEKPVSFFLEEQDQVSPNNRAIRDARRAFAEKDPRAALDALEGYTVPDPCYDPEYWLLKALASMELARWAASEGRTVYALSLLERAGELGMNTPYYTSAMERERLLQIYQLQPDQAPALVARLPEDDRESCLRAEAAMAQGELQQGIRLLEGCTGPTARWYLLRGQLALAQKEYAQAAEAYRMAENDFPGESIRALEVCYRELGDFQNA